MHSLKILSIASDVPNQEVSSEEILNKAESRLSEKAFKMLHSMDIDTRYSVIENFSDYLIGGKRKLLAGVNDLGVNSIKKCIEQSSSDLNIGLFITVTNTAERPLPCMAYEIISMLDEKMMPRDVNVINMQNQGCSVLIKAFEIASYYLQAEPQKQGLFFFSDTHTAMFAPLSGTNQIQSFDEIKELGDYTQQKSAMSDLNNLINCYLFGDGAVSVLLGHNEKANFESHHLTNIDVRDRDLLYMNEGGSTIPSYEGFPQYTLGKRVPERGVAYSKLLLDQVINESNHHGEINHYLVHTGSKKIINGVSKKLHLDNEFNKIALSYFVLKNYGNLSACSIGFMLDKLINEKKERGTILLISFGVGFSGSVARLSI